MLKSTNYRSLELVISKPEWLRKAKMCKAQSDRWICKSPDGIRLWEARVIQIPLGENIDACLGSYNPKHNRHIYMSINPLRRNSNCRIDIDSAWPNKAELWYNISIYRLTTLHFRFKTHSQSHLYATIIPARARSRIRVAHATLLYHGHLVWKMIQ